MFGLAKLGGGERAFAAVAGAILAAVLMPTTAAASTGSLPPAAQGHAYRHGVVPRRGSQASGTSLATSAKLAYGGGVSGVGVATGPPRVYLVFWGSQWGTQGTGSDGDVTLSGDPDGMAPYLQDFMKGLGTGGETWSGVMTQYCQGVSSGTTACPTVNTPHVGYPSGGALGGVWVDESAASPTQSTAHQLAQEAVNAAAHFGDYGSSSQYVLVSPTGTSPDGFITSGFCAWHDFTGDSTLDGGGAVASPPGEPPVAFTNMPYVTDAGASCGESYVNSGSAGTLDGVSIVGGHEYAETITDTFPSGGWTDSAGNEDGDKCAWDPTGQTVRSQDIALSTGRFAVQPTWGNDTSSCEISHPFVAVNDPGRQTNADDAPITPLQMTAQGSQSGQTLTWSATGLSAGLAINSSTGVISGTPTTPGSATVTVSATDTTGGSGTATFTWTIARLTSTTVACDPSPISAYIPTTCTAAVTDTDTGPASAPSGSVDLTPAGSCTLTTVGAGTATCQTTYMPSTTGAQTITARYQGDSSHSSSASTGFALSVGTRSTSTSVACAPARLTTASPTTCTATVTDVGAGAASNPTGTVSVSSAGTCSLTPAPATSVASCQLEYTPTMPGTRAIAAAYGGDALHSASGSGGFSLTTRCPAAAGRSTATTLGALRLGMTRSRARAAYRSSPLRSSRSQDYFCLTPAGVRVGYRAGRAAWATTANTRYSETGVRPGTKLASAERALSRGEAFIVGRATWYLLPTRAAVLLVKLQGGRVREVGIAAKTLAGTSRAKSALARALS